MKKVISKAKTEVLQADAGQLPAERPRHSKAEVQKEARMKAMDEAYQRKSLGAKEYLDHAAVYFQDLDTVPEDMVASDLESSVGSASDVVSDESDSWQSIDEDWHILDPEDCKRNNL